MPLRLLPARRQRGLATAAVLLAVGAAPAEAALRFEPEAEVRAYRNGNVGVTGSETVADSALVVLLRLSLLGSGPSWSYRLSYAPSLERYREIREADNTAHSLAGEFSRQFSRRSSLAGSIGADRTERQGFDVARPDQPIGLVPRTTVERLSGRLDGTHGLGPRSFFTWSASGDLVRYPDAGAQALNDSDTLTADLGWGRELSPGETVGAGYLHREIRFDRGGTTRLDGADLRLTRPMGREATGTLRVGLIRAGADAYSTTRPRIEATLTRAVAERSSLTAGVRQDMSGGGGTSSSATLDRGAFLSWSRPAVRRFEAVLSAAYWRRETLDATEEGRLLTTTLTTLAGVGWRLGRLVHLDVFHSYTKQDASGSAAAEGLRTSYHSYGTAIRIARPAVRGRP